MISKTDTFAFLVLVCAVARSEAQTVGRGASPPICAAMCDTGAGPVVYRVGGEVSQPKVLFKVDPAYSKEARAASIAGTVAVVIEVRPDGLAHNIRITQGLAPALDLDAIDAIRQWRFQPGTKGGEPVTVEANIKLTFNPLSPFPESNPQVPSETRTQPPTKAEVKKQKEAEKKAAKEGAKAALEAYDHQTIPLTGWTRQTASGEPGCLALHDMAFHRDVQRGWGGLLGGGRNALLGVSSSVIGVISNTCMREVLVSVYGKFFDSSGLLLGQGSVDILVPASESRAFQVPWGCSDGANYIGSESTIWIPNCPADTARYSVRYE
jgi:TonB family protein